jgi:hypothetical protein
VDHQGKRVGNMDGLSLMDQLDLLRQDVNDIHGQVKRDKIDKEEIWLMIRATTLDDWGKYQLRTFATPWSTAAPSLPTSK